MPQGVVVQELEQGRPLQGDKFLYVDHGDGKLKQGELPVWLPVTMCCRSADISGSTATFSFPHEVFTGDITKAVFTAVCKTDNSYAMFTCTGRGMLEDGYLTEVFLEEDMAEPQVIQMTDISGVIQVTVNDIPDSRLSWTGYLTLYPAIPGITE